MKKQIGVYFTSGKEEDALAKIQKDSVEKLHMTTSLSIVAYENCKNGDHYYGDMLYSNKNDTKKGILAKEYIQGKIIVPALRAGLIEFLDTLSNIGKSGSINIIISSYQFSSKKEEISFICSLKEIFYLNFADKFNELNLIITDYTSLEDYETSGMENKKSLDCVLDGLN